METQLYTTAYLSVLLAIPHREVQSELGAAGYQPEYCINDVPHWGPDALVWLRSNSRRLQLGGSE